MKRVEKSKNVSVIKKDWRRIAFARANSITTHTIGQFCRILHREVQDIIAYLPENE